MANPIQKSFCTCQRVFLVLEMENRPRLVLSRNNYTWKETAWVSFASFLPAQRPTKLKLAASLYTFPVQTRVSTACLPKEEAGNLLPYFPGSLGRGTTAAKKSSTLLGN